MNDSANISFPGRLAIVLSHPTQYYSPWFRWLREHASLEFRVFYLWEFGVKATRDVQFGTTFAWDVDLLSGYEHTFVPNRSRYPGTHHFKGLINPTLTEALAEWKPTAVLLFGYAYSSHLTVVAWARLHGVPLLFRGDSHFLGGRAPTGLKRLALATLYAQFKAFLYVGAANRDYFKALGVPESRLFFAPHAVNQALFDPAREDVARDAAALRQKLGLPPQTRVVLFAGKFVPAKQPRALLDAFLDVRTPDSAIVFVGDGEERAALMERAGQAPAGTVHFLPFANQSEMPSRYLMADLFVLPSRGHYETWGLAVNEAMHMGRPALVSDVVGCQRDLVADGETGWVFRAEDPLHLRDRLRAALAADLEPFHRRAAERASGYSYARAAEGLSAALRSLPHSR